MNIRAFRVLKNIFEKIDHKKLVNSKVTLLINPMIGTPLETSKTAISFGSGFLFNCNKARLTRENTINTTMDVVSARRAMGKKRAKARTREKTTIVAVKGVWVTLFTLAKILGK